MEFNPVGWDRVTSDSNSTRREFLQQHHDHYSVVSTSMSRFKNQLKIVVQEYTLGLIRVDVRLSAISPKIGTVIIRSDTHVQELASCAFNS